MFLYFLKNRDWLKKNKRFVDTIPSYRALNQIFYESLNMPKSEGVPYLNGSLFEREEYMTEEAENKLELRPVKNSKEDMEKLMIKKIDNMPEPDRSMARSIHSIIGSHAQSFCQGSGTACPPTQRKVK